MFKNPTPVAAGIIPSLTPRHIIVMERGDGGIALPGGYVDELEDSSTAVNREVEEETGIILEKDKWQLFFSATNATNRILLFSYYKGQVAVPTNFCPNEECLQVFEAPWEVELKFPLHNLALKKWVQYMEEIVKE